MAKDHIVPQAYIRAFATPDKQELFFYSRNPYKQKAELGTPAKICYGKDYYYLREDISARYNVAVSHLDQKLLKHYEDNFPNKFRGLLEEQSNISLEDAEFVSEFIVIMKMRSGFFRNRIYSDSNVTSKLQKVIDELITLYPISEAEILETKELLEQQLSDARSPGYLHSTSLLSLLKGERDDFFDTIKSRTLTHRWRLIHAPESIEYISSDNPGFFCKKDDTIENTNFGGDGIFTLPLTPTKALQIDFSVEMPPTETTKNISSEIAEVEFVSTVNKQTYLLSERYIYGLSRVHVEDAITH